MKNYKIGKSKKENTMHYSVGTFVKSNEKLLLIDRANPPYGFASSAGHIDKGEILQMSLKEKQKMRMEPVWYRWFKKNKII